MNPPPPVLPGGQIGSIWERKSPPRTFKSFQKPSQNEVSSHRPTRSYRRRNRRADLRTLVPKRGGGGRSPHGVTRDSCYNDDVTTGIHWPPGAPSVLRPYPKDLTASAYRPVLLKNTYPKSPGLGGGSKPLADHDSRANSCPLLLSSLLSPIALLPPFSSFCSFLPRVQVNCSAGVLTS